jgi:hypothetical protein
LEGVATMSIPSNETKVLDEIITYNFPLNKWRAYIRNGIIFSTQIRKTENSNHTTSITKKYVISNAFAMIFCQYGTVDIVQRPSSKKFFTILINFENMPEYSNETLNKMKFKRTSKFLSEEVTLQDICKKYTIRIDLKIFIFMF